MRFSLLPASALLFCSILGSGVQVVAQDRRNDNRFYDGARRGTHGGNYGGGNYHHGNDHYHGNDRYHDDRDQGGIGPGKGALIGGAAGAALGARGLVQGARQEIRVRSGRDDKGDGTGSIESGCRTYAFGWAAGP